MASFKELKDLLQIVKGAKVATKSGNAKLMYVDKYKAGVVFEPGKLYRVKLFDFLQIDIESSGEMVMFDHKELEVL